MKPTLSILALCHNHAHYIDEALESLKNLDCKWVEIWIADDASEDNSPEILRNWERQKPDWNFVFQNENLGNCQTFNRLLEKCSGEFVIDFATDDILLPSNLANWVQKLKANPRAGFCYANALIFKDEIKKSELFSLKVNLKKMPEGYILDTLLGRPYICPPAVLFRRSALLKVKGYNTLLAYEDLDIWLRISKDFEVVYFPDPVVYYRKHSKSMSASLFLHRNERILQSTLRIVESIWNWDAFKNGPPAMVRFLKYHLKIASILQFPVEANKFYECLERLNAESFADKCWKRVSISWFPFSKIFCWWKRINF